MIPAGIAMMIVDENNYQRGRGSVVRPNSLMERLFFSHRAAERTPKAKRQGGRADIAAAFDS